MSPAPFAPFSPFARFAPFAKVVAFPAEPRGEAEGTQGGQVGYRLLRAARWRRPRALRRRPWEWQGHRGSGKLSPEERCRWRRKRRLWWHYQREYCRVRRLSQVNYSTEKTISFFVLVVWKGMAFLVSFFVLLVLLLVVSFFVVIFSST